MADKEEREEAQEEQPDLVTLRTEYATLSQQLEQLDAKKQARQWARLYTQVQAAEKRMRQAEQETAPSPDALPEYAKQQPEYAKQQATPDCEGGAVSPPTEGTLADERQERLRTLASELIYWREGLKVLRLAQLPKWRSLFQWQIDAQIETLQAAYARLRAETANGGG